MRRLQLLILIMIIAIAAPVTYAVVVDMAITNAVMTGPQEVTVTVEATFCPTCSPDSRSVDVMISVGSTGTGTAGCTWSLGSLGSTDVVVPLTAPITDDLTIDATFFCPWCGYWSASSYILELNEVEIDIKPGSFPSSINLKKKGLTPVAIHTTLEPAFDATNVDPTTILFNGLVAPVMWEIYDCDEIPNPLADPLNPDYDPSAPEMIGDGDLDLVLYFDTQQLKDTGALEPGDTEATLTGSTFDGDPIVGTGDVSIVVQGKP